MPTAITNPPFARALEVLEGLSVGDAFGQCFFQEKNPDDLIASKTLPAGPWYYTDDTEMSLSVLAALRGNGKIEQHALADSLAQRYSYDRAYGPSMHRVLERIRRGEDWRSVTTSAFEGQGSWGNGAAMRVAPLGAYFLNNLPLAASQAALSAEVTHAHPEAIAGTIAVSIATALAFLARGTAFSPQEFLERVIENVPASEVRSRLIRAQSISSTGSLQFAVSILGNGTGMSAVDTVPLALWCCSRAMHDYAAAMWLTVSAGGDRDTLCAIVGGVVTAYLGAQGIPAQWLERRELLPQWHLGEQ